MKGENPFSQLIQLRNARQCLEVHAKSNAKSAGSLIAECIQESRKREALILDSMTRKYGGGSAKTPATPSSSEEFHRVMSLIVDLLVGGQSTATKNNSAMKVLELPIDVVSCQNGVAGMKSYKDPLQGLDTNVKKSDKINLSSHAVDLTSFTLSLIENMGRSVVPATTGSDEVPGFFSWESNLKKALKRAGDAVVEYQNGIARLLDTLSSNGDFPLMGKQGAKPTKEWTELVCLIEDAIIGRQKQLVALLLWSLSNLFHGSGGLAARPLFFLFAVRTKTGIELDMIPSKICDRLIAFVRNDIVSLLVPEASLTKVISVQVESEVKDLRAYVKLDKSVTVIMDDLCYSLNERCKELGVDAAYIKQEFEPMFQVNESNYDQLKKSLFEVKYGAGELERRFAKGTILVRMDSLQKVLLAEISAKSDQKRKALESSTVGGAEPTVTLSRWANLFSSDDKENNLRARFDAFRQSGSKGGRYDTGLNPQMHISRLLEEQRKGIIRPDTSARSVRSQLEQSRNHDREAIQKQIRVTSITKSPRSTMTSQVQDEVEVSPAPSAGKSPRSSLIPPSPQRGVVSPAQSPKRASRPNEEQNKVLTEVLKLYPFLKEQPCPGVFLTDIEFRSNPRFNAAINRLIVKRNTNAVYKRSGLKVSDDASALEGEVNSVLHDIAKELQQTTLEGYKRYPFLDWRIDGVILGLVTLEADEDEQFQTLFKLRNQVIRGASGAADGNKQRLSNTENCLRERARVIASTLMAVNPVKAEVSRIAFRRLQSEEDVSAGSSQNATTPNSSPQPQQQTPDTVSSGKSEITQKNTSQPSAKAATAAPPSKTAVPEPKSAPAIEKPTPAVSAPQAPVSKQPVKQSTQPKQVSPARETKTAAPASEVKPTVAQTDSVKRTKEAPTSQVKEATAEVKPPTTATKKPSAASTQQVEKKDPESSAAKSSAPEKPKSGTSVSKQVTTTASASARVVPTKSEATPEKTACQNRTNGSSFHRSSVLLAMESSGTESTTTLKPSPPPTAPSSCRQEEAREVTDTNRAPGARIASPHIEAPKPAPAKIAAAPKAEPKPTSSALTAKKPVKVAEAKVIKSVPKKKSTDSIPSLPSTPMTTGRGADQAPKHETEGSLFKQFTPGEPQSQYAKAIGAIESDNAQMERMMGQRRSSLQMADLSGTSGVSVSATPPKPVKPPARTVTKTAASKSNSPPGPNNHLESGPMHMSDQFYTGGSQRPSIVKEAGEKDQWAVSQPSPLSSQPRLSDRPQSQPNSGKHLSPTWRSATYSGLEPSKTTSSESLPAMSATQMQSRPQDRDSRSTGAVPRVVPSASSVPRKTSHAKGDAKLQPIRGAVRTQPKLSAPRKGSPKVAPPVSPVTKQPPATTSPTASSRPSRTAYDIMLQRQEELNRSVSSPTGLQAAGKNEYFRTCSPRTQSPSRSPARLGHEPAAPTSPVSFGFNEQVGDRPHLHFPAEASLSEVYLQACEGLGMRPNSGLLRTFPNRHGQYMEKLDLSVNYVGIKGLQPILYVLERNSDHLEHLCLSNNNLENAEVLSLLQVLFGPAGDRLTYLDLSYNPISQLGGQALQRLVNSKPNLGTIKIKGTLIPPKLQQLIVDKVEDNAYRKHIGLA